MKRSKDVKNVNEKDAERCQNVNKKDDERRQKCH